MDDSKGHGGNPFTMRLDGLSPSRHLGGSLVTRTYGSHWWDPVSQCLRLPPEEDGFGYDYVVEVTEG